MFDVGLANLDRFLVLQQVVLAIRQTEPALRDHDRVLAGVVPVGNLVEVDRHRQAAGPAVSHVACQVFEALYAFDALEVDGERFNAFCVACLHIHV